MNGVTPNSEREARGFSVVEILVALLITMVVMASVFMLLKKGQDSFQREPEVADMTASARAGLMRVSQDLRVAGFNTPANMAVMWLDGGDKNPDELTIVYADPEIPVSRPLSCMSNDGMLCDTIGASTVLQIDPASFNPMPLVMESAYQEGMTLFALQGPSSEPAVGEARGVGSPSLSRLARSRNRRHQRRSGLRSCPARHHTLSAYQAAQVYRRQRCDEPGESLRHAQLET